MIRHSAFGAFLALSAFTAPAFAADAPWVTADAVAKATEADVAANGIHGIDSHVRALEKSLADGIRNFPRKPASDGTLTVLTDGITETMGTLMAAAGSRQKVVAVNNPYPRIGLYLGLYYNEAGKPAEALRAIDSVLKLSATGMGMGAHLPALYSEEAVALGSMKRWSEALAAADTGLKLTLITVKDRARFHRSRGGALIELARLDDAETAYRDSLKWEPDHPAAHRQLAHIGELRAGAAPVQQVTPQ